MTARSNRSKSDQDPAQWPLPSSSDALCRYGVEWTATKLRWGLAIDEAERDGRQDMAAGCGGSAVEFVSAAQCRTGDAARPAPGASAAPGEGGPPAGRRSGVRGHQCR
ncbi:hypothetical protein Sxan_02930 [Streptomyces xanthophaeus]|uniref:Uncharacterized protein n=1 Tax=Streptomyces xanthophaeus TaxID=67385 RepID=A0A919GWI5_9ACTN|nr:hypothetical protein Sxan_02930 [Streptomyces xanthophaeus]